MSLNVTCNSEPSKPQSALSWLINGESADESYLRNVSQVKRTDGLQRSSLQLQFNAERHQFIGGIIKLRCTSVISQAYSMSSEEIIVSDHAKASHTHSVHESEGPIISGGRPTYHVGDLINLTCTSSKSYPAPQLKFFINDKEARPEYLRYHPKVQFQDGNEVSVLGLQLRVNPTHFGGSSTNGKRKTYSSGKDNQQIKLKCTATLEKVIDTSSSNVIIGSSQQSSGLHIAENKAVNMNRGQTLLSTQILLLLICCYTTVWYSRS
ncbi:unnamed protein product [Medioppia subpectinata]|uniref:CD80-like immunoglobulin C2-set domain-containing protein n=1 Tax=Medioppia subpectinata TaxID=1979941 RepID=A0A7R9KAV2_9ACAR|nr:unnamed protein product [Medioppia subpectinata]CAG2100021.1 unnamed protein product [Medioppia subpectinata]